MKKIVSLILIACMLSVFFVSCDGSNSSTPGTKPSATQTPDATTTQTGVSGTATSTATPVEFKISSSRKNIFEHEKIAIKSSGSGEITWTSSDSAVATVDKEGIVTGVKKGTATITAVNANGEKSTVDISVVKVADYFTSADYKTLEVKQSTIDEEIKKEFESMSDYYKTKKNVDRAIKEGDVAAIYYIGTLVGETDPFDGGTGFYDLEIGSGSFIDGFEAGLIGHKKGETVTLNLKFPSDYGAEGTDKGKLNGRDVTFVVTINAVSEYVPAEITDDLVNEATSGTYKTIKEYTDYLNTAIFEYYAIEEVIAASEIKDYPKEMVGEYKIMYLHNQYGYYASMYGMTLADYLKMLGKTEEDVNKEAEASAKPYVEQLFFCYGVYADGSVKVPDEKKTAIIKDYAKLMGVDDPDKLLNYVSQADIDNYILTEYAIDMLVNGIKYVDDTK